MYYLLFSFSLFPFFVFGCFSYHLIPLFFFNFFSWCICNCFYFIACFFFLFFYLKLKYQYLICPTDSGRFYIYDVKNFLPALPSVRLAREDVEHGFVPPIPPLPPSPPAPLLPPFPILLCVSLPVLPWLAFFFFLPFSQRFCLFLIPFSFAPSFHSLSFICHFL